MRGSGGVVLGWAGHDRGCGRTDKRLSRPHDKET